MSGTVDPGDEAEGFRGVRSTMSYGTQDLGQLAQALAGSADALMASVQAGLGYLPDGADLAAVVAQLVQGTQVFRDTVFANPPIAVVHNAFNQMDAVAGRLNQYFAANQATPQIQAAWQTFAAIEVQTARSYSAGGVPPQVIPVNPYPQPGMMPPRGGGFPSPVAGLAEQLLGETSAFVNVFSQTGGQVPQGRSILAEAQQLEVAAANFRQNALAGLPPDQLANEFAGVAECWNRLGQQVGQIAQGHTGPNIAQVEKLGAICVQIGQTLGMPGY